MSVNLSDDKTYKRDKLLKIPKDTTIKVTDTSHTTKPNVIKQATKQHKQHLILKADDIKEENIIEGKRTKNTTKNWQTWKISKNICNGGLILVLTESGGKIGA